MSSAILNGPPAPLPDTVPPAVSAVIARCLEKRPERRYQRAGEVHAALEAIQTGETPRPAARAFRLDRRSWLALAAVIVGIAASGLGWWAVQTPAAPTPRIESLVVLPLKNLTGDASQEYFVDGMTEALSATFSRIGALTVISSTSAMQYKNTSKTAPQIAQELGGIDALIEGAVQRSGNQLRVTVSLIHAASDRRLQTAVYERDVVDVFALYSDIAQSASREVSIAISPPVRAQLATARRPDPEAYDAYLKGRYHYARWGGQEPPDTAVRYFEEAIAKDPTFGQAHAALALALRGASQQRERATWAARRAVQLDPTLSEGHAALGLALMQDWDWTGSDEAFQRAIQLDANSSTAYQWYAELLRRYPARRDDALKAARKAAELDPLSLPVKTMVGWVLYYQGRFDEAIQAWDAVLELDPNYGLAIYNTGLAYAQKGLGEQVIKTAQRAAPLYAQGQEGTTMLLGIGYALTGQRDQAKAVLQQLERPGAIAILYFVLGDEEHALEWLERAYNSRGVGLPAITSECGPVWFAGLCDHPRFRALRAKIGLP